MKIRTAKYIVKEGFVNFVRNKLMTIASICVVAATLLVFGIFVLVTTNFNYNTELMKQQPEMQVYCSPDLDDDMVAQVEKTVKSNPGVESTKIVTKKEAFEKVKDMLGNDLLQGLDDSFLPVSFIVKLKDSSKGTQIFKELQAINGVEKVTFPEETIASISGISSGVQVVSIILIIILLAVSTFIISNTIKLTVFARRKEINIMKYIGGTDWFIRWPFVVEGVIIGILGAILAFTIAALGYGAVYGNVNSNLDNISFEFIKLLPLESVAPLLFGGYMAIGIFVGAAGSALSIRKHLKV